MEIRALTEALLEETIRLADKIFPAEYEEEPAKYEIAASLFPEMHKAYLEKTGIRPGLQYWVAIDGSKVIGLIGLYNYESDKQDLIWLGWFLVDLDSRRKGAGVKLLRFAIEEARKLGKNRLRVYTTDDPEEIYSHSFYRKHGFREVDQKPWKLDPEFTEFHFELDLTMAQA